MSEVTCKTCGQFLYDHAGCYKRAQDFKETLDFVKEVADSFVLDETDEEALKKLVYFETKAEEILNKMECHLI